MKPESAAISGESGATERVWQWLLGLRNGAGAPRFDDASADSVTAAERACIELYEPFARTAAGNGWIVAHLGQSVDGFVATDSGDSYYVTGPENIDHLHRMRALADAVIVGAGTIEADDPALTTRRVAGASPVRVVLDGRGRLGAAHRVFTDTSAPTLVVCCADRTRSRAYGMAEVLSLQGRDGVIDIEHLVAVLAGRGLRRLFVEGGGIVVSSFLRAGVLDRLQLTIAPVLIGSGRRGIRAPAHERMLDCLRLPHRLYRMGEDLLLDCDLCAPPQETPERRSDLQRLS